MRTGNQLIYVAVFGVAVGFGTVRADEAASTESLVGATATHAVNYLREASPEAEAKPAQDCGLLEDSCQTWDGGVCCDDCKPCCNMCPCCYAVVEGLLWTRTNDASNRPLVLNQNNGDPLLRVGDLGFNWSGGVRAYAGRTLCCGWTAELGYLGVYGSTASAAVTGNNNLQVPGNLGLAVNNFFGADFVTGNYLSSLNSFEANLACCCCCCDSDICCENTFLFGFRFLNLDERFQLQATDFQEGTTNYTTQTFNRLYGFQVGERLRRCWGRWSLEGTGKAGIFGNDAEQHSSSIVDFPNFVVRPARSASSGQVAFVGELNLTGIYHLNETWGVRAGYSLLWIEGVALAPDQLDFTNTPTSGTAINTNGGVLFHGANLGLEARW